MYVSTSSCSRENLLKAIRFERPDYIPMTFHINAACYDTYPRDALFALMEEHPFLFPDFKAPAVFHQEYDLNARKDAPYTDDFGCIWKTAADGIVGSVHDHPLEDWEDYEAYLEHFPDPEKSNGLGPIDWAAFEQDCAAQRAAGRAVYGDLRHGHTFLQLCDIRGYDNLIFDMADEEPLLDDLLQRLEQFNLAQIAHFLKADVDIVRVPEDLGMQTGPMLSLQSFLRYIKPSYQHLLEPIRRAGKIIHMHSDGDIRLLAEHIIEGGVEVINLQDLVNGIDWISQQFRGKTCVDLDIDRQSITPFGTPEQIDRLILEEVQKVSCREGGLTMIYGLYPGVPLENVKALMDAMERYAFYYD